MNTLILVGDQPRVVLPVLQAAHAMGETRCIVLGGAATRPLRWSALCARHVPADLDNHGRTAEQVRTLACEFPQAVLVPCDCPGIRAVRASGASAMLPTTPLPDPQTLEMFDDKWRFHQFCVASGLPVPPTVRVASKLELHFGVLAATVGLPFVVKPVDGSGSLDVVVVRSGEDLDARILRNPAYAKGPLVAQRYVDGWDIDIDLLAVAGRLRAITVHRVSGCWMEFERNDALEAIAETLCQASGYSGPMNVDARLERSTGRIALIESNPRFWASLASPAACGLNFLQESLRSAATADGEPRRLAGGRANRRHPLLRPAVWWTTLSAPDDRGRLLRATLFDPYTLGELAADLPAMAQRSLHRTGRAVAGSIKSPALQRSAQH
ncbi:MAG: ATP-grasp domain-containing protein [Ramlibacter sp.]